MTPLQTKLREYQLQAGQWLDRARTLETQAKEAVRQSELIQQRIAGINEAIELLAENSEPDQGTDLARVGSHYLVTPRKRNRSLSENWQQIMQLVDGKKSFGYDALAEAAELAGHEVGRDTLRSQMSLYKGSGLVESVGDGEFRLTAAGRRAAGINEDASSNENGEASAEPDGPDGGVRSSPAPDFDL